MPSRSSRNSLARLGEFRLIRRLSRRFGHTRPSVLRGIGDDAALIRPTQGTALLLTTDLLAEGVHFDLRVATLEDIGYKAAVVNLSDIAAMGGIPQYLLVALAVPSTGKPSEIEALYRGLMRAARAHGVALVGGDTSASHSGWFIGITLAGAIAPGLALTRDGARVGDLVYVSGTLGDSLAGLSLLRRQAGRSRTSVRRIDAAYLVLRHLRPTPRIQLGRLLAARRLATSAIDLSDGLSGDLAHICEQSRVGAEIAAAALPLSPAARRYAAANRIDPVQLALNGGEDYELLFTVPPRQGPALKQVARRAACRLSHIGEIRPPAFGLRLNRGNGSWERLVPRGYQHFQPHQPLGTEAGHRR
jgi:thiamine-monophosphate kinase